MVCEDDSVLRMIVLMLQVAGDEFAKVYSVLRMDQMRYCLKLHEELERPSIEDESEIVGAASTTVSAHWVILVWKLDGHYSYCCYC
jgi:hypothetical protein